MTAVTYEVWQVCSKLQLDSWPRADDMRPSSNGTYQEQSQSGMTAQYKGIESDGTEKENEDARRIAPRERDHVSCCEVYEPAMH